MKQVSVIGSTGSIGVQTLKVMGLHGHRAVALAAGSNADLLIRQALEHRPRLVAIHDRAKVALVESELAATGIRVVSGEEGVLEAAALAEAEIVLNAAVGIAGLGPTLAAVGAKKNVALANKESLVCAGDLVMGLCTQNRVTILPVDSEHSAIFQCLQCGGRNEVERVILTASGGPFFGAQPETLEQVTPERALRHPNWSMGRKISIDSATMMNKGFETIEAMYLFDLDPEQIDVVVHRESIVHSLVEYCDGAVIAQLSPPDMGLAIQYALDYPARRRSDRQRLDLAGQGALTFFGPDAPGRRALDLCRQVMERRGNSGAVVNGANEKAVELFLSGRLPFTRIVPAVAAALEAVQYIRQPEAAQLFASDRLARRAVEDYAAAPVQTI